MNGGRRSAVCGRRVITVFGWFAKCLLRAVDAHADLIQISATRR
jgi:hypothetical protein